MGNQHSSEGGSGGGPLSGLGARLRSDLSLDSKKNASKLKNYKVTKKLGEGTYGIVHEAIFIPTGQRLAIKSILKKNLGKDEKGTVMVHREINTLIDLDGHENIIKLHDWFETKEKFYLAFEMAEGGELFDRIADFGRFTEKNAAEIVFEVLHGISYLHAHGIVHRDLKPENILYRTNKPDSHVLIADFGVCNVIGEGELLTTLCGSPAYAAPEVLRRSGHGKPADIWSVGVITFTLLMGYGPFYYCQDLPSMFDAIIKGMWKFESPWVDRISRESQTFIKCLMNMNPDKRPTARQALLDPWLLKYSAQAKNHAKKLYDSIKKSRPAAPLKSQAAPAFIAPDRTTSKPVVQPTIEEQSSVVQPHPAAAPVTVPGPSAANGITNGAPPVPVPPKADHEKEDDVDDSSNDSGPIKRKTTVIHQTPSNPFFHPDGFIHDDIANITNTDDCLERLSTQVQASVDPKDEANLVEEVWNLQEAEKLVITPKKRFQRAVRLVSVMNYLESESKEHFSDIYDEYLSSSSESKTLTEGVEKMGL